MKKKKSIICFILFLTLLYCLVNLTACETNETNEQSSQSQINFYTAKSYQYDEILTLYQNNKDLFDQIAKIISSNEKFWNTAENYEEQMKVASILPNDTSKLSLFSSDEQEILQDFFEQTLPLEIDFWNKEYIEIYYREQENHIFSFLYYYDITMKKPVEYTEWYAMIKDNSSIAELGNYWFLYLIQ